MKYFSFRDWIVSISFARYANGRQAMILTDATDGMEVTKGPSTCRRPTSRREKSS